jgi:hypothetical protein
MHYELLPTYSTAIDVCFMHAAFGKSFAQAARIDTDFVNPPMQQASCIS